MVNADDPLVLEQARRFAGKQIRYGVGDQATLKATGIEARDDSIHFVVQDGPDQAEVHSDLFGVHNVHNLLAGIAAARALEVPLDEATRGLDELRLPLHRGERHWLSSGAVLIDDTYNSNPAAAVAAIKALRRVSARRHVAVLGDMLELGDEAESLHRELGESAAKQGVDLLIAVGEFGSAIVSGARAGGMSDEQALCLESTKELHSLLAQHLRAGDAVLFKASRGLALDRTVEALVDADERNGGGA